MQLCRLPVKLSEVTSQLEPTVHKDLLYKKGLLHLLSLTNKDDNRIITVAQQRLLFKSKQRIKKLIQSSRVFFIAPCSLITGCN